MKQLSFRLSVLLAVVHLCDPRIASAAQADQAAASSGVVAARKPLTQQSYHLQLSDIVEITFPFSPEYNQVATVQPDGRISLKETVSVIGVGQTLPQLEENIVRAYTGILRDPKISITLKDFQRPSYFASGEVGKPGRYDLRSDTSLLQAIAEAGGILHERAKRTEVVVFHPYGEGMFEVKVFDLKAMLNSRTPVEAYPLRPGDVIYVPQNNFSKFSRFLPSTNLGTYISPGTF